MLCNAYTDTHWHLLSLYVVDMVGFYLSSLFVDMWTWRCLPFGYEVLS